MSSLSEFCRIWVCSSIPNHQLPNSNFSSYRPSNLGIEANIDRLLRRPRQGSSSLMHIIRRSEKLVVLAGVISIC